jgi:glutamyl-tRNA synthetase
MSVRYAPSPTGRLHLGNLRTAWISKRWAEALGVAWVVRFEDIDRPRVVPGAREQQTADLAALGLVPDRVYLQSERIERHWELFSRATQENFAYPCFCSRKEIREAIDASASAPHTEPPAYNGRCRDRSPPARFELNSVAWRMRGENPDGSLDVVIARTATALPDRTSFAPSYPFACAIDDLDGGYALLVRAWDLASAADSQRRIRAWVLHSESGTPIRFTPPGIFHCSLITRNDGHRLEKRTPGVTLPELAAAGYTVEEILKRFSTSFSTPFGEFSSGKIFGEPEKTKTLLALDFAFANGRKS